MVRKSLNILKGIKGTIQQSERKNKRLTNNDKKEEIDICLSCTKPAEECKGDCKLKRRKTK